METVINKAVGPLITALALALASGMATGEYNFAEAQTALVGALTALVVWYLKYAHERITAGVRSERPTFYKFAASVLLPLAAAVLSAIGTGDVNNPEIQLGVLAVVGGAWTWLARYYAEYRNSPQPSGAGSEGAGRTFTNTDR